MIDKIIEELKSLKKNVDNALGNYVSKAWTTPRLEGEIDTIFKYHKQFFKSAIEKDYISKDKVRKQIDEIVNVLEDKIKELKSLLKELKITPLVIDEEK